MVSTKMLGLALLGTTLAGCQPARQLFVDGVWVRLGAVRERPSAAYFTIHGGPTATTLINVTTDVAIKSEMHESMASGGVTSMKPVNRIAIPANTDVAFKPGGRHVMLFDVNPSVTPGKTVLLTFSFADGTRLLQNAGTIGAGDPAPQ